MSQLKPGQAWIIENDTDGTPLIWGGDRGWVSSVEDARLFTDGEKEVLNVPIEGTWMIVAQCPHLEVRLVEDHRFEYDFASWNPHSRRFVVDRSKFAQHGVQDYAVVCEVCHQVVEDVEVLEMSTTDWRTEG